MKQTTYFIHFQDFVDALVGPFQTLTQCLEYIQVVQDRGDSASVMGIYAEDSKALFDCRDWKPLEMTPMEEIQQN